MIQELAKELGMTQTQLLGAIHRASYDQWKRQGAGPFKDSVGMGWARDLFDVPGDYMVEHQPSAYSAVLIYGATERVSLAASAARTTLA